MVDNWLSNYEESLMPSLYKSALAKICNTWDLFHKNIKELEHTLKRSNIYIYAIYMQFAPG